MRGIRTDLAMESVGEGEARIDGVTMLSRMHGEVKTTDIYIRTIEAAQKLEKRVGRYTTIEYEKLPKCPLKTRRLISELVCDAIYEMLPKSGEVLIIGLGNRNVTADALGTRVVERVLVTRHLRDSLDESTRGKLRGVSAIAPGVLGITGIETAELSRGLVSHVKPCCVIAIDALAACDSRRICTTIQITDTGIDPGSGVGNHRLGLNRGTLDTPVIAVGVPMVVYAATIARDALSKLISEYRIAPQGHQEATEALLNQVSGGLMGEMVVTPRDIDELVLSIADMIAAGLNRALHPALGESELGALMHQ